MVCWLLLAVGILLLTAVVGVGVVVVVVGGNGVTVVVRCCRCCCCRWHRCRNVFRTSEAVSEGGVKSRVVGNRKV